MKMLWQNFMRNIKRGMVTLESRSFHLGLVINPKYSWLGASPDKIVYDPTSNPVFGGLEIKCIESGKGMTPLQHIWLRKSLNLAKGNHFA